jgi:competence protein ComEA
MKMTFIVAALSLCTALLPVYADVAPMKTSEKQLVAPLNKINLNKADVSSLIGSFKGIGEKRAQAIIAYRDSHKGFKSIEELAEVKGLGQHFVQTHREKLNEVFSVN